MYDRGGQGDKGVQGGGKGGQGTAKAKGEMRGTR